MNEQKQTRRSGAIGDTAVKARTGKTWAEWFANLDGAGATRMSHKEIVAYLGGHHQVPEWWQQMVTVTYEQGRGLREKHETPGGFQVSVTKTISSTPEERRRVRFRFSTTSWPAMRKLRRGEYIGPRHWRLCARLWSPRQMLQVNRTRRSPHASATPSQEHCAV